MTLPNASEESLEALASGDKVHLRALALEYVRRCREYGTTADQACEALGLGSNSVAPRLVELQPKDSSSSFVTCMGAESGARRDKVARPAWSLPESSLISLHRRKPVDALPTMRRCPIWIWDR